MTEIFATGLSMGESPRWHDGRFWMCDWVAGESGAVWYASVPQQRCVRVAEGGQVLQTIPVDRGAFACMLGGEDGRTLYVVANRYGPHGASDGVVLTERVTVPRAGRP